MRYRITIVTAPGATPITYTAIGNRDQLQDAAYDDGAQGVSVILEG
jgi:hypothetical protein